MLKNEDTTSNENCSKIKINHEINFFHNKIIQIYKILEKELSPKIKNGSKLKKKNLKIKFIALEKFKNPQKNDQKF